MTDRTQNQTHAFLYGTTEQVPEAQHVSAGPLSARIDAGALRSLSIGDLELVRQIDFPIRDENWASLPSTTVQESLVETDQGFRYEHRFAVANGGLECRVIYSATPDGRLTAEGEATAHRDFVTNRTGFTVLHPLDQIAGHPVRVRHASGRTSDTVMPDLIMPSQPIKDIAGLGFDIDGGTLDLSFEGEVFEMEDQRNWSDASYKTYCRPLIEPFAYTIRAGETLRQRIDIRVAGGRGQGAGSSGGAVALGAEQAVPLPQLLLAVQDGWLADDGALETLAQSGASHLLVRVTPDNAQDVLRQTRGHLDALQGQIDLEVILHDDRPAGPQLLQVAAACHEVGVSLAHVIALPRAYLASYQPSSLWPQGLQPDACFAAAQQAFPDAKIGTGMLTNFTEFNRCRPTHQGADFITHGNAATVHAADDASVMQTLETLPHIFRSARAIGGQAAYRVGLSAIGMRTNPYGNSTVPNPDQHRLTMTVTDPRARALFGAVWAVGAIAATDGQGVQAIALAAPAGPFGVLSSPAEGHRPWYDDHPTAKVYPMFHVLRAFAGTGQRVSLTGVPNGMAAVAARLGDGTRLVLANLTDAPQSVDPPKGRFAVLDTDSFEAAATDACWLDHAMQPAAAQRHTLPPFAIHFWEI